MRTVRNILLLVLFSTSISVFGQNASFNERSRVAIGGGGNLAFQTVGGYNLRAYLQFSQKWKMVALLNDTYTHDRDLDLTTKNRSYGFNVLHAWKEYEEYDVLYFFEGVSVELWNRPKEPKLKFREINSISGTDTLRLIPSLNVGVGFEKPMGPIGFYTELTIGIGSVEWASITFGLKTNLKRIFRNPKKRYDLNLEDYY